MNVKPSQPRQPRQRKTRWSVWLMEHISRVVITIGGIGTIVAVVTVFLFLLYVVLPLFMAPDIQDENRVTMDWSATTPVQMGADEDQLLGWALFPNGELQVFDLHKGALLEKRKLFKEPLTAWSFAVGSSEAAFGFADGTVQQAKIGFTTRFLKDNEIPPALKTLGPGEFAPLKKGILVHTKESRQFRLTELSVELKEPAKARTPSPIVKLDRSQTTRGSVFAILSGDGSLRLNNVEEIDDFDTGGKTYVLSGVDLPYTEPPGKGPPSHMFLSSTGNQLSLFWKDGHLQRLDLRNPEKPVVAEERNLLDDPSLQITDVCALIGRETYLVGDSSGRVKAWFFALTDPRAKTSDGGVMVCAHEFPGHGAAVTTMTTSHRSRTAAIAFADGKIRLLYITSDRVMAEFANAANDPAKILALMPKDDGLLAGGPKGFAQWKYDPRHPEITTAALFTEVWYEGYDHPQHMWQSSGNQATEPKFGLMPLIFGTLKASFYSLLFGVPLALLAAVYTSEFLHPSPGRW